MRDGEEDREKGSGRRKGEVRRGGTDGSSQAYQTLASRALPRSCIDEEDG